MTITPLRRETSRRNGRRSTGPCTSAGRARSSENAWRHGLRAVVGRPMPLPPDPAYQSLRRAMFDRLRPQGPAAVRAAQAVIQARWALYRLETLAPRRTAGTNEPGLAPATRRRYLAIACRRLRAAEAAAAAFASASGRSRCTNEPGAIRSAAVADLAFVLAHAAAIATNEPETAPDRHRPELPRPPLGPTPDRTNEPKPSPRLNRHQRRALQARTRR